MARLAWTLAATCALLALATAVAHLLPGAVPSGGDTRWWTTNAAAALSIGAIGGLVAARRPGQPFGWLLLVQALGHAVCGVSREYGVRAVAPGSGLPLGDWALWLSTWTYADVLVFVPLFLLFPAGRLRSWRWRPVAVAGGLVAAVVWGGQALVPYDILDGPVTVMNPLGWPAFARLLAPIGFDPLFWALNAVLLLGLVSMGLHAREAQGPQRRSTVLVALAGAVVLVEWLLETYVHYPFQPVQGTLVTVAFAAAVAVAVLRYGLWGVDVVVGRTLVYGALLVLLGGVYAGLTALADTAGGIVGAGVVALLFAPLRDRLRRRVDRWLFGDRDDPYAVIASLGAGLHRSDVLPALADTVAGTLKLPYVAIELLGRTAAERGELRGEPLRLPLAYGGEAIGTLTLGPRTPADRFGPAERRLFADIARQVGVAAHAVRLTEDLQRSREQLVAAREEERRRLRRDLHDGLGPTLAGVALQLGAARRLPPDAAAELHDRIGQEVQAAIADIRRLVYDLRPPALDELGLVHALRRQAQRFPGLDVTVEGDAVEGLSAAVEVAAYRIATEALTNVSRHAQARSAAIRLSLNGALEVEVVDDGAGMAPGWRPGVGVQSIHERAAELGGSCSVVSTPGGGTRVLARIPCGS